MKKKILSNILIAIALIIAFLCMLKINLSTHIYHDEFVYSAIYGTEEKIDSLLDIFVSAKNIYLNHNGRVITHFVLSLFLMCGSTVRSIINSLIFTLLIFELIKFAGKENHLLKASFAVLLFPLLWCTIPAFGETVVWISGSVNYLWTTVVLLFFIYLIEKIFEEEKEYGKWKLIGFCVLCFVLATLHEMTGIISIAVMGLMLVYLAIKNKKINKTLLLGTISGCLGFLCLILSPGSNVRKMAELQTSDVTLRFLDRLKNSIQMLISTIKNNLFLVVIIIAITIIFAVIKYRKNFWGNKPIMEILFLVCASVLSYLAMAVSPTFLERVTFAPYIMCVYAGLKCFSILNVNKKVEYCELIVIGLTAVFFIAKAIPSIGETFDLVEEQRLEWEERDENIAAQKAEGKEDIYVEAFTAGTNSHLYFADLSTSITYNHNKSMAVYYEVNSIRLKKNYYLDISLENVNEENTDSIKALADGYEETKKFYLLDKEIYDKQAPYKRYKNSYEGGEITLYFAMDNADNLKIAFTKAQTITISTIKLYTPEDTVIEISGSEILEYFDLTNVSVVYESKEGVTLDVQENGEMVYEGD